MMPGRPEDVRLLVDERNAELRCSWLSANAKAGGSAGQPLSRIRAHFGQALMEAGRRVMPPADNSGLVRPVRSPDGC